MKGMFGITHKEGRAGEPYTARGKAKISSSVALAGASNVSPLV